VTSIAERLTRLWRPRRPDVTICLSAYESEAFVAKAVACATAQTHRNIRILISIDRSSDRTAEICEALARTDRRIEVVHQREHLGWAGNANYLLSRVDTEYFFFYFHDDLIEPHYAAVLLAAIRRHPQAALAYCDMDHFGGSTHTSKALDFDGPAAHRLMTFFVTPDRGSPLRGLTRRDVVGASLRMQQNAVGGLWANEPYLLEMAAAGGFVAVPRKLYHRWDDRPGGLTDGWKGMSPEDVVASYRTNMTTELEIIGAAALTAREREAVIYGLYLNRVPRYWRMEAGLGRATVSAPADIHPTFAFAARPNTNFFPPRIQGWIADREDDMRQLGAQCAFEGEVVPRPAAMPLRDGD